MNRKCGSLLRALALGTSMAAVLWGAAPALAQGEHFAKPSSDGTVDVATAKPAHTLVIVMSGDGGWWGDLDAQLANRIAKAGYAVIGLDTNIWFTDTRTPQQVADHLADLTRSYMTKTGAQRYVLIGYSFGADMVAPAYARMSEQLEQQAGGLIMLSPGEQASFQVNVLEETGVQSGSYALGPDFSRLPKALTVCIYGSDEANDTGCHDPALKGAALVSLPGGHHYNHAVAALTGQVLSVLKSKAPA